MKEDLKRLARASLRCYLTTQLTGLLLIFIPSLCASLFAGRIVTAAPFLMTFLLAGFLVTAIPTLFFSAVMSLITKKTYETHVAWFYNALCSIGLTLFIFFALFPFFSTFHPPERWVHRFPSEAEWGILGLAVIAGLAGTANLHAFWKRKKNAAQQPPSPYAKPGAAE